MWGQRRGGLIACNNIRVIDIDGQPWFVVADVCETLGLKPTPSNGSYQNHYRRFDSDELGLQVVSAPSGKSIRLKLVSESGFYKLVLRSKKPEAAEFQNWVTRVVLPSIRKNGGYIMGQEKVATGEMTREEGLPPKSKQQPPFAAHH